MTEKSVKNLYTGLFLVVIIAIIGGSVSVSAKVALQVFHPFTLIALRFLCATLFLLPFVTYHKQLHIRSLKKFFWIGTLGALNPILLFIALQFTQASVSPLIYAGVPAMTVVYLYFTNNEKLNVTRIIGILLGLIGVSIIVLLPLFESHIGISALQGNILIFFAAIAFMLYATKSKHAQDTLQSSPLSLVFYFTLITLVLSLPLAMYEIHIHGFPKNVGLVHIANCAYLGFIGTGVMYLAYQYALKRYSVVAVSLYSYLQPLSTIILAVLFLDEKITPVFILGGILAIVGAALASK